MRLDVTVRERKRGVLGMLQQVITAALASFRAQNSATLQVEQDGFEEFGAHRMDFHHLCDRGGRLGRICSGSAVSGIAIFKVGEHEGAERTKGILGFFREHVTKLSASDSTPPLFWWVFDFTRKQQPLVVGCHSGFSEQNRTRRIFEVLTCISLQP